MTRMEGTDLQIGMRQCLCHIYSLFWTKSETSLKEVNGLELRVKRSAPQNKQTSKGITYLRVRLGKKLAERLFLAEW